MVFDNICSCTDIHIQCLRTTLRKKQGLIMLGFGPYWSNVFNEQGVLIVGCILNVTKVTSSNQHACVTRVLPAVPRFTFGSHESHESHSRRFGVPSGLKFPGVTGASSGSVDRCRSSARIASGSPEPGAMKNPHVFLRETLGDQLSMGQYLYINDSLSSSFIRINECSFTSLEKKNNTK